MHSLTLKIYSTCFKKSCVYHKRELYFCSRVCVCVIRDKSESLTIYNARASVHTIISSTIYFIFNSVKNLILRIDYAFTLLYLYSPKCRLYFVFA